MVFSGLFPSLDGKPDDLLLLAYATVGLFLFRLQVEAISLPRLERSLKRAARDNPKYDAKKHAFEVFDQLFGVLCECMAYCMGCAWTWLQCACIWLVQVG